MRVRQFIATCHAMCSHQLTQEWAVLDSLKFSGTAHYLLCHCGMIQIVARRLVLLALPIWSS